MRALLGVLALFLGCQEERLPGGCEKALQGFLGPKTDAQVSRWERGREGWTFLVRITTEPELYVVEQEFSCKWVGEWDVLPGRVLRNTYWDAHWHAPLPGGDPRLSAR